MKADDRLIFYWNKFILLLELNRFAEFFQTSPDINSLFYAAILKIKKVNNSYYQNKC
jgi:hypothetical protein